MTSGRLDVAETPRWTMGVVNFSGVAFGN